MDKQEMKSTKKKWSLKKKIIVWASLSLGVVLLLAGAGASYFFLKSAMYVPPKTSDTNENHIGLVMQGDKDDTRRSIYGPDGKKLILKGVNAGQILLQESWMSPYAIEPLKDENGQYEKDQDGNLKYGEFTEEDFLNGIESNPNLRDKKDELLQYYYSAFFAESDFSYIKNELKFNCIRLPFYWRNILDEDENGNYIRKDEDVAFKYLDWFVGECKKNGLYVILDLHGAPGSQNGYEHSGLFLDNTDFWNNQKQMDATVDLWDYVSSHYSQTRKDLAPTIASYDLLNEPQVEKDKDAPKECFEFQDRIYKTIRDNGDDHLVTIEVVWSLANAPLPEDYGWENIMYEMHNYNWNQIPMGLFKGYFDFAPSKAIDEVPMLVGEFNYFEKSDFWHDALVDWYDQREYSWTIWNYKTVVSGDWDSSWGVWVSKLKLKDEPKCNVSTCTEEEFKEAADKTRTTNCKSGYLKRIIDQYNAGAKTFE